MQTLNSDDDVAFGRRVDLLVNSEQDEDADDIELCSVEFKKEDACFSTLFRQQCKNIRLNACILNDIHLLLTSSDTTLAYLDFSGRHAYISHLFKAHNNFIAYKASDFVIIKSLCELDICRRSIINLYTWRSSLVANSQLVTLSTLHQKNKFALADVSTRFIESPTHSPPYNVKPAKIFLSPSKGQKRTRSIFDAESEECCVRLFNKRFIIKYWLSKKSALYIHVSY
jgi:hypothetical protein